jgi:hypothetical protein
LQSSIFSNLEEKEVLSLVAAEAEEGALPLVAAEEKGALLLLAAKAPEGKEPLPCVSAVAAADSKEKEALSLVASPATVKGAPLLAGGGRAAAGISGG